MRPRTTDDSCEFVSRSADRPDLLNLTRPTCWVNVRGLVAEARTPMVITTRIMVASNRRQPLTTERAPRRTHTHLPAQARVRSRSLRVHPRTRPAAHYAGIPNRADWGHLASDRSGFSAQTAPWLTDGHGADPVVTNSSAPQPSPSTLWASGSSGWTGAVTGVQSVSGLPKVNSGSVTVAKGFAMPTMTITAGTKRPRRQLPLANFVVQVAALIVVTGLALLVALDVAVDAWKDPSSFGAQWLNLTLLLGLLPIPIFYLYLRHLLRCDDRTIARTALVYYVGPFDDGAVPGAGGFHLRHAGRFLQRPIVALVLTPTELRIVAISRGREVLHVELASIAEVLLTLGPGRAAVLSVRRASGEIVKFETRFAGRSMERMARALNETDTGATVAGRP